jgi:hypothetical protein
MKQTEIEVLRDFAIDHLPRAQNDRAQMRYGGTEADFYRRLAFTSVMVQGRPEAPAIEKAAARVLSAVSLLCIARDEPLTKHERADQLEQLTNAANELSALTGKEIQWLDSTPRHTEHEEREEPSPTPRPETAAAPLAGKYLTTEQAAEVLGIRPTTLTAWAREQRGPLQPTRLGREYRWAGDAIQALMQSGQTPKPRPRK